MTKLIVKIADYIFRKEDDIRKGIGDIIGKVLELVPKSALSNEKKSVIITGNRNLTGL